MENKKMKRKSQAWGIDFIVAITIFSLSILAIYIYSINSSPNEGIQESLKYDGDILGNSIFSSGNPENWNESSVEKIGIIDDGKINETKLASFYNLSISDYPRTKSIFNTRFDYFFTLSENMTLGSGQISGIGKPGFNPQTSSAENLQKLVRFTVYKDKPVTAYLYIWEES